MKRCAYSDSDANFCPSSSSASTLNTWLTIRRLTSIPSCLSDLTRRSVSATANSVGMVTMQNSACAGSWKRSSSSAILSWNSFKRSRPDAPSDEESFLLVRSISSISPASIAPNDPKPLLWNLSRISRNLWKKLSRNSGNASSLSVWPVGAVSMIRRSNGRPSSVGRFRMPNTFDSATSSSVPGGAVSKRSSMSNNDPTPSVPVSARKLRLLLREALVVAREVESASRNSATVPSVSISSAKSWPLLVALSSNSRRSVPSESILTSWPPPRLTFSASPRECAGSVLTTSVLKPFSAILIASAAEEDDLPTPPFPPMMIQRRLGSSNRSDHMGALARPKASSPKYLRPRGPVTSTSK
mmetsp:Transcript_26719/g.66477  ORF Transcript_26719/g.66477 Transcript_26719/m.66477 type:complete len:356 (-) Transcript_26719:1289-2356(-)